VGISPGSVYDGVGAHVAELGVIRSDVVIVQNLSTNLAPFDGVTHEGVLYPASSANVGSPKLLKKYWEAVLSLLDFLNKMSLTPQWLSA
jgi:hypothetical protein